jgi:protein-S-isoprenylcysteine O-methyltransferase Ste14
MQKLLPPILFIMFVVSILLAFWLLDEIRYVPYPYNLSGIPLVLLGIRMAYSGKKLFKKVRTNINTFHEPDILVTEGLYEKTRNPIYLGFVIALLGVAFLSQGTVSSFLMVFLFILITDKWYIKYEETILKKKFGTDYIEYCKRTRRWI